VLILDGKQFFDDLNTAGLTESKKEMAAGCPRALNHPYFFSIQ